MLKKSKKIIFFPETLKLMGLKLDPSSEMTTKFIQMVFHRQKFQPPPRPPPSKKKHTRTIILPPEDLKWLLA